MENRRAGGKRSPIKLKPLHTPGQSLRRRLDDVLGDRVAAWLAVAVMSVSWATLEWFYWLINVRREPVLFTAIALVVCGLAYWRIRRARFDIHCLRQGIEGEQHVGQFLERLRTDGYEVLHDIEEDGFNVDHVLIGPTGVFAIETKTVSKPNGRDARVVYDGEHVTVDGHEPDRNPLTQAEGSARCVRHIIKERTGQDVPVQPVVLYPGWYIQRRCAKSRVWVLNENYLLGWLDHEPARLADSDVRRYATALADHVRARRK